MTKSPRTVYLKDYQVPPFLVESINLYFELYEHETLVHSELDIIRNSQCEQSSPDLILNGDSSLELFRIEIDGRELNGLDYSLTAKQLQLKSVPDKCKLKISTRIHPEKNTALEGLYKSDSIFCTQCEAEGFRRITFFPDRPDVMSVYRTTIEADQNYYPVLLSNGNLIDEGSSIGGRHWVTWEDPFPKPCYLFALVAGDLQFIEDSFMTCSGRKVCLRIYAEEKDLDKLDHAMLSLKKAMRWDEQIYGREYDLDIYMIVAVDFFNMGAMENKGLNIFNTACVLANPQTTTDTMFQRVESVVAHEYFHNWSGNRVTCRDWFQLSLKEGFTVFRDAEFSADMNSRTLKRIEDVNLLRTAQFAEDAGPMAHPIRPDSFIEISNFYTLTVYEKGAEVVRMLHRLLGKELFRQATDLYFQQHDGKAVTTEDFVQAMEAVSKRNLTTFRSWYSQAGTPELQITDEFDSDKKEYWLKVKQYCPPTPGQSNKVAFHIPLAIGLLDQQGREIPLKNGETTEILNVISDEQEFYFPNIETKPIPSLLRGFSAPVRLSYPWKEQELYFLMMHDSDGFSRWDAAQKLLITQMQELIIAYQAGKTLELAPELIKAFKLILDDISLDNGLKVKLLTLPSESHLAELATLVDVDAIHQVRKFMRKAQAEALESDFLKLYQQNSSDKPYKPEASDIADRSIKNFCLACLMTLEKEEHLQLATEAYYKANNMTDMQAALTAVVHSDFQREAKELLADYYQRWSEQTLVVNSWLSIQASNPRVNTLEQVKELTQHPAFDANNPNKVRSLVAVFCSQNPINFHAEDGNGYKFLASWIIELNIRNPQIASRLVTPLTTWKKYDKGRRVKMKQALQSIIDSGNLSTDVFEVVHKSLAL